MSNDRETLARIEEVLERDIRPVLALHGGNIRSLSCEDGVYHFQLTGQCAGCPSADLTSEELVRSTLLEALPQGKYEIADDILRGFERIEIMEESNIAPSSLVREFIGGSIYAS